MLNRDYFSHTSSDGKTVKQRLESCGYTFNRASYYGYGENIALGSGRPYATVDYLFKGWMKSKQHKRNILKDNSREVGIGVKTGTYKTYNNAKMTTWTSGCDANHNRKDRVANAALFICACCPKFRERAIAEAGFPRRP